MSIQTHIGAQGHIIRPQTATAIAAGAAIGSAGYAAVTDVANTLHQGYRAVQGVIRTYNQAHGAVNDAIEYVRNTTGYGRNSSNPRKRSRSDNSGSNNSNPPGPSKAFPGMSGRVYRSSRSFRSRRRKFGKLYSRIKFRQQFGAMKRKLKLVTPERKCLQPEFNTADVKTGVADSDISYTDDAATGPVGCKFKLHNTNASSYHTPSCVILGVQALRNVTQGTSQQQRVGNKIRLTNLWGRFNVWVTGLEPIYVRMVIFRPKAHSGIHPSIDAAFWGKFLQWGGSTEYPYTTLHACQTKLNTDVMRVLEERKFWLSPVSGYDEVENNGGDYAANLTARSAPQLYTCDINLKQYQPAVMTYNDNDNSAGFDKPRNMKAMFLMFQACTIGSNSEMDSQVQIRCSYTIQGNYVDC